jgi:metal-responsive CopG/Arc/MetJ family transcriptional regulator
MWKKTNKGIEMTTKTIQMTLDDTLLSQVDETVQEMNMTRSAFIRNALIEALRCYRIRKLEEQEAAAYARIPQSIEEVEIWAEIQEWGDEWNVDK